MRIDAIVEGPSRRGRFSQRTSVEEYQIAGRVRGEPTGGNLVLRDGSDCSTVVTVPSGAMRRMLAVEDGLWLEPVKR